MKSVRSFVIVVSGYFDFHSTYKELTSASFSLLLIGNHCLS